MNKANKIYIDRFTKDNLSHISRQFKSELISMSARTKDLNKLYRDLQMNNFIEGFMSNNPGLMMQVNASKGSNVKKLTIKVLDSLIDELNKS
jgi:hypothetical protein